MGVDCTCDSMRIPSLKLHIDICFLYVELEHAKGMLTPHYVGLGKWTCGCILDMFNRLFFLICMPSICCFPLH